MIIDKILAASKTVAIFGHVRPDGDCVGSTTGIFNYIKKNFPHIKADLFLENFPDSYKIIKGTESAKNTYAFTAPYDTAFLIDTSSFDRVGANGVDCIKEAKISINIDHHISNPQNLCTYNFVEPDASSASEVLYCNLDPQKIDSDTASSIYLGIVHDTGTFKFSSTKKRTMQIVGELIEKGVDFSKIINDTYYTRSFKQTKITGYAMENCKLSDCGRVVYSYLTPEDLEKFQVTPIDLGSIIDTIREVSNTEVAILLYPVNGKYKISLRSNYIVDVNKIAKEFGGGGHIRAAGGETSDSPEIAISKILELVKNQLS